MIEEAIQKIKDGYESIELFRDVYFEFKRIKALEDEFKELQRDFFDKFDKKELEAYKIEKRQGRKMYDFSKCKSWSSKKEEMALIEKKLKVNSELDIIEYIDQETGELITLEVPEIKYGKDVVVFKS